VRGTPGWHEEVCPGRRFNPIRKRQCGSPRPRSPLHHRQGRDDPRKHGDRIQRGRRPGPRPDRHRRRDRRSPQVAFIREKIAARQFMKNRNWVIVFVVLAILGLLAVGINWAYNAGEPLTPEKLKAAEDRWERNRPPNYALKITVNKPYAPSDGTTGTQVAKSALKVRNGQIVDFPLNGQPPQPVLDEKGERNLAREREIREGFDIDGLFDSI